MFLSIKTLAQITDVLAVRIAPPLNSNQTVEDVYKDPATLLNILVKNSLLFSSLILFLTLIYGGIRLIISSGDGDPKAMAANQQIVTSAIIGFIIVFSATLIVTVIQTITGVQIIK